LNQHRKSFYGVAILAAIVTTLSACASYQSAPQEAMIAPTYSWSPAPTTGKPQSTVLAIALTGSTYASAVSVNTESAISTDFPGLRKSIETSFQQMLLSKGLKVSGPFASLEDMTYQTKKLNDMAVYASLSPTLQFSNPKLIEPGSDVLGALSGDPSYKFTATVRLGGTVTIVVLEPFTGEKLLVKRFTVPTDSIPVKGIKTYQVNRTTGELVSTDQSVYAPSIHAIQVLPLLKDPGVERPVAIAFESYFRTILNTIDNYISFAEMKQLDIQATQVREQARFVAN